MCLSINFHLLITTTIFLSSDALFTYKVLDKYRGEPRRTFHAGDVGIVQCDLRQARGAISLSIFWNYREVKRVNFFENESSKTAEYEFISDEKDEKAGKHVFACRAVLASQIYMREGAVFFIRGICCNHCGHKLLEDCENLIEQNCQWPGTLYRGGIARDFNGTGCMHWQDTRMVDYWDSKILRKQYSNYCRKGKKKKSWCYVKGEDKVIRESFCNITNCNDLSDKNGKISKLKPGALMNSVDNRPAVDLHCHMETTVNGSSNANLALFLGKDMVAYKAGAPNFYILVVTLKMDMYPDMSEIECTAKVDRNRRTVKKRLRFNSCGGVQVVDNL